MQPLMPIRPQLTRHIGLLGDSPTRVSLMSVAIPALSRQATVAAVLSAATAADLVGMLPDGSVGIFVLNDVANVDERFLPRLQASLVQAFAPAWMATVKIWFRSIHRWSMEISDADDLVNSLLGSSVRVVGICPPPAQHHTPSMPLRQARNAYPLML
jgi:hypothetical protein